MAKIGIRDLTYATYSSGGNGSAVTYTGGVMKKDYMVRGELTVDHSGTREDADDHMIDVDNSPTGVHLALELANLEADMLLPFCGLVAGTGTNEHSLTGEAAPYIGCGYIMQNRFKGVITFDAIWIHKIQFHQDSLAAQTKGENTEFQHENVTGDGVGVQLAEGGAVVYYDQFTGGTTLSAAETWLKGKAGIS